MHFPPLFIVFVSFIFRGSAVFPGHNEEDNFGHQIGPTDSFHNVLLDIDQHNFPNYYDGLWHWQELLQNDQILQQIATSEQLQGQQVLNGGETHQNTYETTDNVTNSINLLPDDLQHLFATDEQQQFVDETSGNLLRNELTATEEMHSRQQLLPNCPVMQHLLDNDQMQHLLPNDQAKSSGQELQHLLDNKLKDEKKRVSKRRRYSMEEKREIVAKFHEMKAQNPNRSNKEIAKILNVSEVSLFEWIRGKWMMASGARKSRRFYSLGQKMHYVAKYDEIKAKNPQMTDEQIAKQLGTTRTNLHYWKRGNFGQITNAIMSRWTPSSVGKSKLPK